MASSVIKAMSTSEPATPNSTYVGNNYLFVTKVGKLVNVAGRFQIKTEKPSGQSNYLFSGLPAPSGVIIPFTTSNEVTMLINLNGHLTSNEAIPAGYWQVQFTYCTN